MKGTVETYSLATHKLLKKRQFAKIKDFAGDPIDAEVFKLSSDGESIFALVRGNDSKNNVYELGSNTKNLIIQGEKFNSVIIDIAAVGNGRLVLALLSNEFMLYDIKTRKTVYRKQASPYAFSAMSLSGDKKYIFSSDESGVLHKISVESGKVIKSYIGQNVDNVLCVDAAGGLVAGGGKDRRIAFYNETTGNGTHIILNYFITALAVSPDGKKMVWFNDNNNTLEIFSVLTKSKIQELSGHDSSVNKIKFVSGKKLISCGNDGKLIIWEL